MKHPLCRKAPSFGGFSLVSLLVVIALVALLAAMILATLPRVLRYGNDAKCLANLRQLGLANIAFANDNNGLIAAGSTSNDYWWWYQLPPYLDGNLEVSENNPVLICPSDATKGWGSPRVPAEIMRRSYGVNSFLQMPGAPYGPKRMLEIPSHARTVYAGDTGVSAAITNWISGDPGSLNAIPPSRHNKCSNYVFLDGHVEKFEIATLHYGKSNARIFTGTR